MIHLNNSNFDKKVSLILNLNKKIKSLDSSIKSYEIVCPYTNSVKIASPLMQKYVIGLINKRRILTRVLNNLNVLNY
jgi:hypothetical protein